MTGELPSLFLEIGELLLEFAEPLLRRLVALLAQRLALDLELHDAALELVELRRHRVDLHAQLRRGFVDQIDRLVGQESIGDVPVRQHGGRDERGVLELHPVVDLVALAQAAQDADGVLDRRLADHHGLESPLERRVLLDVLAVLVERRGADGVQLAPGQHRLQHVGRVHRPFGCAGADHRVQLVDEEDDLSLRVGDLLEHGLQPLLELAAVLGSGDQRPHVERDDAFVLEAFGHVAAFDAAREPLDNRGLADAGLSDEHGVVLRAAGEHLDDAANLLVAADDRVELLLARHPRQIAPVLLQRLVRAFRVLAGHALRAADAGERREDRVARDACLLEQLRRGRASALVGERDEQVLGADEVVLEAVGFGLCLVGDELEARRHPGLGAAVGRGQLAEQLARAAGDGGRIRVQFAQQVRDDAVSLLDERCQEMLGLELRVVGVSRELDGGSHRLARFFCVLVDVHRAISVGADPVSSVGADLCVGLSGHAVRPYICYPRYTLDAFSSACSASKCVRCSGVSSRGSWTSTVAYRSPCSPLLPVTGIP